MAFVIHAQGIISAKERCLGLMLWPFERRADAVWKLHGVLRTWRSPPEESVPSPTPGSRRPSTCADSTRLAPRIEPSRLRLTWSSAEETV
jgi:hypothetical protein